MATKKYLELQEFTETDLMAELEGLQGEYAKMCFDHKVKGLDNPMLLKELRKDIARVKTEIRRRQLANMSEAELAKRARIRARRRWKKK
ncbi:MAG TPA: 50S ribosomal protein L29 [Bacteroidetes bacterium]|nr:50S ribosomal protein L29 [Bacteroidota bacterium]